MFRNENHTHLDIIRGMFLSLDAVSVRYARSTTARAAVDRVTLTLAPGQIGVLIGPSGCGKTSLLRAVAGLEQVVEGRVRMDGRLLSDAAAGVHLAPEERRIGMVFQDYALFPHLSIADNVAFGIHRLPKAERQARWRAPWRRSRNCCCWTSPSPAWTWTCASAWRRMCGRSSRRTAPGPWWSRTTSSRPLPWAMSLA